jgi:hypothetical protein
MKSVEIVVNLGTTTEYIIDINGTANIDISSGTVRANNFTSPTIYVNGEAGTTITADTLNHIVVTTGTALTANNVDIGRISSNYGDCEILYCALVDNELTAAEVKSQFNKLAALPLYQFDFSKYPSNTTVYDDFLPYSSARIASGSFKVNDGKLECVTGGQIVFRNAHEFDGDEYIKLTINDTVYAGTGTITQGTTTASIEQGSTLITVDMVAGDTIDSIDIQFREPVE